MGGHQQGCLVLAGYDCLLLAEGGQVLRTPSCLCFGKEGKEILSRAPHAPGQGQSDPDVSQKWFSDRISCLLRPTLKWLTVFQPGWCSMQNTSGGEILASAQLLHLLKPALVM